MDALTISGAALQGFGILSQQSAAQSQQGALRRRQLQLRQQAAEASVARSKELETVIAHQTVVGAMSAASPASGQFQQLAKSSYNRYLMDDKDATLNLQIQEDDLNRQIAASKAEARGSLISGALGVGTQLASYGYVSGWWGGDSGSKASSAYGALFKNSFDSPADVFTHQYYRGGYGKF